MVIERQARDMRYYVIYEGKKHYFPFNYGGFKEAQAFLENHGIDKATIYVG